MKEEGRNQIIFRYGTAITVSAYTAGGFGSIVSWTSPALEHFKSNNTDFPITSYEMSWIALLLPIGLMIGYLSIPIIINRFDRKWILLTFALPQIISFILIVVAKNPLSIYIARILGGIGYGGGSSALVVFLSEIATQKTRGIFLSLHKMFFSIGVFFVMLVSAYFPYNHLNFTILATMSFFVFSFVFMPSSADFREENKREEEMKMLKLPETKQNYDLKNVLEKNTSEIEDNSKEKVFLNLKIKESCLCKLVTIQVNRRALLIVLLCAAQDVLSGHTVGYWDPLEWDLLDFSSLWNILRWIFPIFYGCLFLEFAFTKLCSRLELEIFYLFMQENCFQMISEVWQLHSVE